MAIEVKVPSVGESVTEGRIAHWLKKDGESVKTDEPLFELESDKAAQEIAAPAAGVLTTLVPEGEIVKIGQVVATVDPSGVAKPEAAKPAKVEAVEDDAKPDVILSPAAKVMVE
jgi:2-oxoglutarate dehydrogenase E2 component (dihydrolipoamide succinyltransferase)